MSDVLVILGSARGDSNTATAVKELCPFPEYDLVDLRTLRIYPYQYNSTEIPADDFHALAEKMVAAKALCLRPLFIGTRCRDS